MFTDKIFGLNPNNHKFDKMPKNGEKLTEKKHIENMRANLKKKIKNRLLK